MFWFIVLLLVVGAGFYFYQKMMAIEREIRAELDAVATTAVVVAAPDKKAVDPEPELVKETTTDSSTITSAVEKMTSKAEPIADESFSLEDEILAAVKNLPGVKQTELYSSFGDVNRKQLQKMLKKMADAGKLRREKKGSSYFIYPS